jgi:Peptidase family M28/PDZ domain
MKKIIFFLLLLLPCFTFAQIEIKRLHEHIEYLASDKLKGRATSTKGALKAAKYVAKQFKKIGLIPKGTNGYDAPFTYHQANNPHAAENTNSPAKESKNVVGYIDNGAEYTIIIGAHYDHLGEGEDGNSLDPNPKGKIHNGADDNASGTAGVIELARYYQNNGKKEPYNLLFMAFSGEELGLYGSKKFCENPTIDLSKVHLMLNMDMIGRYNEDKAMVVGGVGTAPQLYGLVNYTKDKIHVKIDSAGIGPSDHTSFYLKNIPVFFFFTGQHGDYHKPTDDAEKINYEGEADVLAFAIRLLDGAMTFPKFTFTPTKSNQVKSSGFKVTLGVMPDYVFDGKGMRIDGVTDGKPAFKAGLKAGDIVIKIGDTEVLDVQTYMQGLSKFKKGDSTTVKIKRGAEEIEAAVSF